MPPIRVVVLLVEPVVAYDAAIPAQVLGEAAAVNGQRLYDVKLASLGGATVATTDGYGITPHGDETLVEDADIVIVPGTHSQGPRHEGWLAAELLDALQRRRADAQLASICSGAFVLAAAGLLDDKRATTHWAAADEFRRLYPRVMLDPRVLYVDEGGPLTSAGLSAGVDLCLHLIRRRAGAEVANRAARHMVVQPWREGGQAQFIDTPVPDLSDQSTAAVRTWAVAHLDEHLSLDRLARTASMSVRTFNRRFRAETGMAPGAWLIQQRVRHAQRLLETTDLSIDNIAASAGFGTSASLRARLRAATGLSPMSYRIAFRSTV
jgi:transcriptional regulator GlxA family with amidase domain